MAESIEHSSFQSIPIVEKEGKKFGIIALTDLDGTANDETAPESKRLLTITPAKEAISQLQSLSIPVGIITSRSHGEALIYQESLRTKGPIICEDGAALALPNRTIILSNIDLHTIRNFLEKTQQELKNKGDASKLISTLTSSVQELQQFAGHSTLEMAKASADRIASAYVVALNPLQRKLVMDGASNWGIRAFGEVINLIGEDANKGNAIHSFSEHASEFYPNVQGIIPIVFGNNNNDLKLFSEVEKMGGIGILVGHPKGGFFVDESSIPPSVVKSNKPYGIGMKESIPQIIHFLQSQHSFHK